MSAFNEGEGAFALADAGGTAEQHADALDVDQGGVKVGPRSELLFEEHRGLGREVLGLELRADQGDAMPVSNAQEQVVDGQATRHDHGRDLLEKDVVQELLAERSGLVGKVGHLTCAEKLQALIGKLLEIACHRQRRTVERLLGNHVVEALLAREELHLEHVLEGFEELADGDGFRAGIRSGIVHGVRV